MFQAASATTKANVEKAKTSVKPLALPLLHRTVEIIPVKVELPEEVAFSDRKFQKLCQNYLKENCTDPSCNYWFPPDW